ncbi:4Fe-4S dicluster domain-containing protein [Chloroflexota bacterium]
MADKAILYDATKCTACRGCQVACKNWNELEAEDTVNRGTYENPADLSPKTWLKMKFKEVGNNGTLRWLFTRQSCMHCADAACVAVCPTGALYHNENGIVSYDKGKCTGCGYCAEFCPFDVPRLDKNRATGLGRMDKCTMCTTPGLNRLAEGDEPACVKTCPSGALIYGDRDKMVAEGAVRVATLKGKGVSKANLYGEKELNGLHVLYVLDDSPKVYDLIENPKYPATATAWKDVIQPLGWAVGGAVALGLALNVMVARARQIREKEETGNASRS